MTKAATSSVRRNRVSEVVDIVALPLMEGIEAGEGSSEQIPSGTAYLPL
jgi:hypothetical protein